MKGEIIDIQWLLMGADSFHTPSDSKDMTNEMSMDEQKRIDT